jgi:RNA polymerase sigma-70 factor (ECF subfamily)
MRSSAELGAAAGESGRSLSEDLRLMEGVKRRDAESLARLYDRHVPVVFALCLRVLRDSAEAEDTVQDVFWEIWRRADRYEPARGTPRVYLMNLARSRSLDRVRRKRRREDLARRAELELGIASGGEEGFAEPTSFQSTLEAQQRSSVCRALDLLPTPQRRALMLSFFDGMTHREIAAALDTPVGTVKTRIRQGLLRLRDHLLAARDEEREEGSKS